MIFTPPLQTARLIRRYKRFLADMEMPDGTMQTVHCPNTGSMTNCMLENGECWLAYSDNPKRKYSWTWQLSTTPTGDIACINTHLANHVVAEALEKRSIKELASFERVRREVKYGDKSRIDFLLEDEVEPDCYVEVKSVTLLDRLDTPAKQSAQGSLLAQGCSSAQGYFPDAVSTRGQKHLRELMAMKAQGNRAVLLFCVMHTGIKQVSAAHHIDPKYAQLLKEAASMGVEVLAYGTDISPEGIKLSRQFAVNI